MTSTGQECLAAGCEESVEQKPAGRRRRYCSDKCGVKYRKYQQDRPRNDHDAQALELARELERRVATVVQLVAACQPQAALIELCQALDDGAHLRGAVVQQAHDRKITSGEMSKRLHVSADTLNRWKDSRARRRKRDSSSPSAGTGNEPSTDRPLSRRHPEPAPRSTESPPADTSLPDSPAKLFSQAMSRLHRESGLTFTALGEAARVDRSYVYRVVAGERLPSWKVTRRLARACDVDPGDLRPLWEAARGYRVTRPGNLHAALRGMNLAAGHLTPETLASRANYAVTQADVTGLLAGTRLTNWRKVTDLVTAMGGSPDLIRPLWEAASAHPGPTVSCFHPTTTPADTPFAAMFGLGVSP
ncbi:helix-turn-helix domain-containing protein [Streptomyces albipurpureus]|uniref:Helix-turn-helix domain-containing protein n=1 Tax=Streptomyces albipurpureus TaxID=2897419 RepID=A0ABT0UZ87_9ACTN|nr:helix-turn-helix transcriptional regulator [Streptomyces sp. CWNU-1]MCM2393764.1 helix-turn-helix domain-containing protein [Streptomyces sp. CWNU-1]